MKNKKVLFLIILFNVLFLLFNIYYYNKTVNYFSTNTVEQENNFFNDKDFKLQDLMNYINEGPDKTLISEKFVLIKLAADPLYELSEYEGCDMTSDILSISYGIEGTYKINNNASVKITIIKDNTANNGNYIFTKVEPSYESSFFKVKNTYLIFETFINSTINNTEINENMVNVINFEQKFYNYYNNYLENLGL